LLALKYINAIVANNVIILIFRSASTVGLCKSVDAARNTGSNILYFGVQLVASLLCQLGLVSFFLPTVHHDFVLQLVLDSLNLNQQVFRLNDNLADITCHCHSFRRNLDQVRHLNRCEGGRVDRNDLLVLLEQELELVQFHLEQLDVVQILVSLLLQLLNLGVQLPLTLLSILLGLQLSSFEVDLLTVLLIKWL